MSSLSGSKLRIPRLFGRTEGARGEMATPLSTRELTRALARDQNARRTDDAQATYTATFEPSAGGLSSATTDSEAVVAKDNSGPRVVGPGTRLRETRLAAGLEIAQVAHQLHLDERVVEALEADRYEGLPAPTFVRGYLASYAKLLDLEPEPVLKAFRALDLDAPSLVMDIRESDVTGARKRSGMPWMTFAAVVLLAVGYGAWEMGLFDQPDAGAPPPVAQGSIASSARSPARDASSADATPATETTASRRETAREATTVGTRRDATTTRSDGAQALERTRESAVGAPSSDSGSGSVPMPAAAPQRSADSSGASARTHAAAGNANDAVRGSATAAVTRDPVGVDAPRATGASARGAIARAPTATPGEDSRAGGSAPTTGSDDARAPSAGATATTGATATGGAVPASGDRTRTAADSKATTSSGPVASAPGTEIALATPSSGPAAATGDNRLLMRFTHESWVEVHDAGGKQLYWNLVQPGSVVRVNGDAPFRVLLGRADDVLVTMDNRRINIEPLIRRNMARFMLDPGGKPARPWSR